MRSFLLSGFATIAILASVPAFAQGTDSSAMQTQPVIPETTGGPGDKIVCKSLGPEPGSRIGGRRVCQPSHAWEAQAADARREIELQQNRALTYAGH